MQALGFLAQEVPAEGKGKSDTPEGVEQRARAMGGLGTAGSEKQLGKEHSSPAGEPRWEGPKALGAVELTVLAWGCTSSRHLPCGPATSPELTPLSLCRAPAFVALWSGGERAEKSHPWRMRRAPRTSSVFAFQGSHLCKGECGPAAGQAWASWRLVTQLWWGKQIPAPQGWTGTASSPCSCHGNGMGQFLMQTAFLQPQAQPALRGLRG